ncbi:HIT family protein [Flagellimonas sp. DF-77]|uniref:HIT family protein n=1 Tax=Flagellimonas algarum TaxID=3230298 RepID=UPI00339374BC
MASIFTKIINGDIPSYKVAEDADYIAFLDINPNAVGHTLCVPKKEVDQLFDLDDATYLGLMAFAKKVGKAIGKAVPCERVGLTVIGLEVPHVHIHLIPLQSMENATFQHKVSMDTEAFERTAESIRKELS